MHNIQKAYNLSEEVWRRKALTVRSILVGSVFMCDSGEFKYSEETLEDIRYIINREFEVS